MEHKDPRLMTPFDNLVTPPMLYTLKLMLPYTPAKTQRTLGIYIKFLELRYTLEHFYGFSSQNNSGALLEQLKDYMKPEEKEMMEQMEMIMNMMEMMQNTPDASGMPDFSELFGNSFGDFPGASDSESQKGDADNE